MEYKRKWVEFAPIYSNIYSKLINLKMKVKGKELNEGDFVICTIGGILMMARVAFNKKYPNRIYLCQNEKNEDKIINRYGFKYSWSSSLQHDGTFSQNVIIYKIITKKEFKVNLGKKLSYKMLVRRDNNIYFNDYSFDIYSNYKDGASIPMEALDTVFLCSIRVHPDCCGAMILYNFCNSSSTNYSRYKYIKDEDFEPIIYGIKSLDVAAKIIHLASNQPEAHIFVRNLEAIALHTYTNPKSGREITIYHLL